MRQLSLVYRTTASKPAQRKRVSPSQSFVEDSVKEKIRQVFLEWSSSDTPSEIGSRAQFEGDVEGEASALESEGQSSEQNVDSNLHDEDVVADDDVVTNLNQSAVNATATKLASSPPTASIELHEHERCETFGDEALRIPKRSYTVPAMSYSCKATSPVVS